MQVDEQLIRTVVSQVLAEVRQNGIRGHGQLCRSSRRVYLRQGGGGGGS